MLQCYTVVLKCVVDVVQGKQPPNKMLICSVTLMVFTVDSVSLIPPCRLFTMILLRHQLLFTLLQAATCMVYSFVLNVATGIHYQDTGVYLCRICAYLCVCMFIYVYKIIYACIYIYISYVWYIYVYIYIYIYICRT